MCDLLTTFYLYRLRSSSMLILRRDTTLTVRHLVARTVRAERSLKKSSRPGNEFMLYAVIICEAPHPQERQLVVSP